MLDIVNKLVDKYHCVSTSPHGVLLIYMTHILVLYSSKHLGLWKKYRGYNPVRQYSYCLRIDNNNKKSWQVCVVAFLYLTFFLFMLCVSFF